MTDRVTPPSEREPSPVARILDTAIGLGALLLILPALPIVALVWLLERLTADKPESDES